VFTGGDIRIIRTPIRAPRANAIAERFIGTLRRECLDHILITGPRHLAVVLREHVQHFNTHRPHRSLDQRPPVATLRDLLARQSTCSDEIGSAASSTSTCRSHEVTGFFGTNTLALGATALLAFRPRGGSVHGTLGLVLMAAFTIALGIDVRARR
jgi:hypothetical protein